MFSGIRTPEWLVATESIVVGASHCNPVGGFLISGGQHGEERQEAEADEEGSALRVLMREEDPGRDPQNVRERMLTLVVESCEANVVLDSADEILTAARKLADFVIDEKRRDN